MKDNRQAMAKRYCVPIFWWAMLSSPFRRLLPQVVYRRIFRNPYAERLYSSLAICSSKCRRHEFLKRAFGARNTSLWNHRRNPRSVDEAQAISRLVQCRMNLLLRLSRLCCRLCIHFTNSLCTNIVRLICAPRNSWPFCQNDSVWTFAKHSCLMRLCLIDMCHPHSKCTGWWIHYSLLCRDK